MELKSIEQILSEPIKWRKGFEHRNFVNESYHGVNMNVLTNGDISEAINTAAGIDSYGFVS